MFTRVHVSPYPILSLRFQKHAQFIVKAFFTTRHRPSRTDLCTETA